MATLSQPARAEDTFLSVDDVSSIALDGIYAVDDELVVVRGKPSVGARLLVGRGHLGTARASHASGTDLVAYSANSPGGGGSISATDGAVTVDPATSLSFPAGTLTDAGGGVGAVAISILSKTVTLTDAQIKALPNTGIEIISAPGANKVLHLLQAFVKPSSGVGSHPYTNLNAGGGLNIGSAPDGGQTPSDPISFYNDAGESLTLFNDIFATGEWQTATPYFTLSAAWGPINREVGSVNEGIFAKADSAHSNLTGGDAGNSLRVTVLYIVVEP